MTNNEKLVVVVVVCMKIEIFEILLIFVVIYVDSFGKGP